MKACFKCDRVLSLSNFYRHPKMADGYLNKCKECTKRDVRKNRKMRVNYYRWYDQYRETTSHRRALKKTYQKHWRERWPEKYRAHTLLGYAVRSGHIQKHSCSQCGSNVHVEGHHFDYNQPLNVIWLCRDCHKNTHKKEF